MAVSWATHLYLFLFLSFFAQNSSDLIEDVTCRGSNCIATVRNSSDEGLPESNKQSLPLKKSEGDFIIQFHKNLREGLEDGTDFNLPKASYMKNVVWNETLAKKAQTWVEECSLTEDPSNGQNGWDFGQNIALVDITDPNKPREVDLKDFLQKWSFGTKFLTPDIVSKYRKPTTSDFNYAPAAQMLQWNTTQLGCGRSMCKLTVCDSPDEDDLVIYEPKCRNKTVAILICNYYPKGKINGGAIYLTSATNHLMCLYDKDKDNVHCNNIYTLGQHNISDEKPQRRKNLNPETNSEGGSKDTAKITSTTTTTTEEIPRNFDFNDRMSELWPFAGTSFSHPQIILVISMPFFIILSQLA